MHLVCLNARPALFQNCCVVLCIVCFVSFYVLFVCKYVLLPPGDNPIAVNKYIISCAVHIHALPSTINPRPVTLGCVVNQVTREQIFPEYLGLFLSFSFYQCCKFLFYLLSTLLTVSINGTLFCIFVRI